MSKKSILKPPKSLQRSDNIDLRLHDRSEDPRIILRPQHLCETRNGDLAFSLSRLRFRCGRPMLVEHLGGLFLEHTLCGRVLTQGYGDEFDILHVFAEEVTAC